MDKKDSQPLKPILSFWCHNFQVMCDDELAGNIGDFSHSVLHIAKLMSEKLSQL